MKRPKIQHPRSDSPEALDAAWRRVQEGIAAHHAGVEPDANFSARVLERLQGTSSSHRSRGADAADATAAADVLGWAALRFLPWAAGLAIVALLLAAWAPPLAAPEAVLAGGSSEDAVLGFLLTGVGGAP